jgi:CRISPR-associated protein Cmr5
MIMDLTIQQNRAKFALERIQSLPQILTSDKEQGEFISYASGLPAMIHMNGLGQAMAFYKSKSKSKESKSYGQLYQLVSDWLCKEGQPYHGKKEVLEGITQCDMAHYQLAQAEALVLMSWVKKFAKAFLAEDA